MKLSAVLIAFFLAILLGSLARVAMAGVNNSESNIKNDDNDYWCVLSSIFNGCCCVSNNGNCVFPGTTFSVSVTNTSSFIFNNRTWPSAYLMYVDTSKQSTYALISIQQMPEDLYPGYDIWLGFMNIVWYQTMYENMPYPWDSLFYISRGSNFICNITSF